MRSKHGLVQDWVRGWALCRATPSPVAEPDGYRIDVGVPGHRVRFVLNGPASTGRRAATLTAPGTWLKVCGDRAEVVSALSAAWRVEAPEYLMSAALSSDDAGAIEPGYSAGITSDGDVHDVAVLADDGTVAASGRVAIAGEAAVVDQVATHAEHRRRGLGRYVMRSLGVVAAESGATRSVLVATAEGLTLYRTLGWAVESEITAAHLPERS
ncbi:GNAT family N-acetyltransferase [Saccharopolyspora shandongensis]|uniref:GNAT family N-acetyltransferase n=1 Tax=Saccharopolyspora shandongensis TaxID=418495 RepID=UPI003415D14F